MSEQQAWLNFEGPLDQGDWFWSFRSGVTAFRPTPKGGVQNGYSQPSTLALKAEAEALQEHIRDQLNSFEETQAQLKLRALIRIREFPQNPTAQQNYCGFWGQIKAEGHPTTIFGSDPSGKMRYRRGPWEEWPQDLPRFASREKQRPMVLSPFCGTLLHEAVGHGMEAEFISGSLLKYRFGETVSSSQLTVKDCPDHPGYAGSMTHDDTGLPATQTTMIHNGVLVGDLGVEKGVWRRASFQDQPLIRASNFIIAPGKADPRNWIAQVPKLLYVTGIQSGSWLPGSQKLKVLTGPVYLLDQGQPVARRSWVVFEFSIMQLLDRIEAVGGDFRMDPQVHWCMKKNQAVPMGMGSPSLFLGGLG